MPAYSAGSPCKSRDPSVKLGQCILIRVEVTLCPAPPRLGRAPAHGTHTPAPRQTPPELGSGQRELTPVLGAEEVKMQLFSLGVLERGGSPGCWWGSEMGRARAAPLRIPIRRPGDHHPLCRKLPEAGKVF